MPYLRGVFAATTRESLRSLASGTSTVSLTTWSRRFSSQMEASCGAPRTTMETSSLISLHKVSVLAGRRSDSRSGLM